MKTEDVVNFYVVYFYELSEPDSDPESSGLSICSIGKLDDSESDSDSDNSAVVVKSEKKKKNFSPLIMWKKRNYKLLLWNREKFTI